MTATTIHDGDDDAIDIYLVSPLAQRKRDFQLQ
jgi:hypothetical protein